MLKVPKGISADQPVEQEQDSWINDIPAVPADSQAAAAPPAQNEFLNDIPDVEGPTQKAYGAVADTDPDHNAKVLKYSQQFNQPPEFIDKNMPQAEKAASAPGPTFFQQMESGYPGSTKFFQKPENMATGHDDIPNMVKHEDSVQKATEAHGVLDHFVAGAENSALGLTAYTSVTKHLPTLQPAQDRSTLEGLAYQVGGFIPDAPLFAIGGVLGGAAGAGAGTLVAPVAGSIVGTIAGAGSGAFALVSYIKSAIADHYRNGDSKGLRDSFDRLYEIGKETTKSAAIGAGVSTIGAAAAPFGAAGVAAAEVAALTVLPNAIEDRQIESRDLVENTAFVAGLHTVGVLGAKAHDRASTPKESFFKEALDQERAVQSEALVSQLVEAGAESKIRKRNPEAWKQQLSDLTKDGPAENVYIDSEAFKKFFQSGKDDPAKVAEELNAGESYQESLKTGDHIRIPLVDFVDKLVDKTQYKELLKDVKLDPEHLSPREVETRQSESKAGIESQVSAAESGDVKPVEEVQAQQDASNQAVFDNVRDQLVAAGQGKKEAEANARLFSEANNRRADRLGVDPHELFKGENFKITNADGGSANALNQDQRQPLKYESNRSLLSEQSKIEKRFAVDLNEPKAVEDYNALPETKGGKIIAADLVRDLAPEYAKDRDGRVVHTQTTNKPSAAFVNKLFDIRLKEPGTGRVLFTAGGPGSGKTTSVEGMAEGILNRADIVFDQIGASEPGFKMNVDKALESGRKVDLLFVYQPLERAADLVAERFARTGRSLPAKEVARLHVKSLDTFLSLSEKYKEDSRVNITIVDNSGGNTRLITVDELNALRYNKTGESTAEAVKRLIPTIEERLKNVEEEVRQKTQAYESGQLFQGSGGVGTGDAQSGGQAGSGSDQVGFSQGGDSAPRGSIEFGPDSTIVRILKSADKSTFPHEMFHYFVGTAGKDHSYLKALDNLSDKQKSYVEDMDKMLKFVGADSFETMTRDQHETLAREGEAYLREGKAPSEALRGVFSRFREWMLKIYKSAKDLGVEINPEIRGVFDRLLASEQEIDRAARFSGVDFVDLPDIPDALRTKIRDFQMRARETAINSLLREQMPELSAEGRARHEEIKQRLSAAAESDVRKLPLFEAIKELDTDKKGNPYDLADKGLAGELTPAQSAQFEAVAEVYGYADGAALAKAIVEARDTKAFEREVSSRVDAAMKEFGDLKDSSKIRDRAIEAIHNDHTVEMLALEREALASIVKDATIRNEATKRNRIEAKLAADSAKIYARESLSKKRMKDATNARIYITAERNAAVRVAKALAKGDHEAAAKAKGEQLQNHALAAEAIKNRAEAAKILKKISKYARRGRDLLNMPYGFTRQVDQLLGRYGLAEKRIEDSQTLIGVAKDMLAKGEEPAEIANRTGFVQNDTGAWIPETLSDFVGRVNDNYYSLILPDSILSGTEKSYREIPLSDLRDIGAAAEAIAKTGKDYNRFLGQYDKLDIREAAAAFKAELEQNVGTPYAESLKIGSDHKSETGDRIQAMLGIPDGMVGDLVNVLTLCKYLAGGKDTSIAHDHIYRPLEKSEQAKIKRLTQVVKEVRELFEKTYSKEELASHKIQREMVPELGRYMTKEERISMLLNWGNEGNRDRIRDGYKLTNDQVESIINKLDKKDFDFAQSVRDYLGKFWPEIVKLEMDVNGVEPRAVEPAKISSPYGEYDGGYYPISYDPTKSADAYRSEEQKNALYKQFSSAKAHTETGHAKARAARNVGPIRLSYDVLFNHIENVVHDLEFRKSIIDVNRFLSQRDVNSSLVNALGVKGPKAIGDWLKAMGSDQTETSGWMGNSLRWLRFNTTFATLGFRIVTVPVDVIGNMINASRDIGAVRTVGAVVGYAFDRGETREFVESKSERMRNRSVMRDRDLMEMSRNIQGEDSAFRHYAFYFQSLADEIVSIPLWKEVFKRNVAEHGEEKAGLIANEAVARRVGSGSKLDQVGVQRGSEQKKLLTMYYSYTSMMFNQAWLDGKIAGLEYRKENYGKALAVMANSTLYLWALQSINENFWKELFRNNQQDDKKAKAKRIAARTITQPFSYVPLVRDIVPYAVDQALGTRGNVNFTPVEQALESLLKPVGQGVSIAFSHDKHFDQKYSEEVAKSAAILLKYPQSLNTMTFNFLDWQSNKGEATWRDALTRRTKK